jgi:hypothetical protein
MMAAEYVQRSSTRIEALTGRVKKRQAQRQIRRILPGLNGRARSKLERFSQATRLTQSLFRLQIVASHHLPSAVT